MVKSIINAVRNAKVVLVVWTALYVVHAKVHDKNLISRTKTCVRKQGAAAPLFTKMSIEAAYRFFVVYYNDE